MISETFALIDSEQIKLKQKLKENEKLKMKNRVYIFSQLFIAIIRDEAKPSQLPIRALQ